MKTLICLAFLLYASLTQATAFDHGVWDDLLKRHVVEIDDGVATQVDYDGFVKDRALLKQYLQRLQSLTRAQFDSLDTHEQLAFLINAYNAWTVEFILEKYPELESIRDLGSLFRSPWKKKFIPLLGQTLSLDDIEHDLIRGSGLYNEPRIHFAVNCASIGCPALRKEAYTGDKIEQQLQDNTEKFLRDRSRNRLEDGELQVSAIFNWYREDFEKGWNGIDSLEEFFGNHAAALALSQNQVAAIKEGDIDIDFLKYDWKLNKKN